MKPMTWIIAVLAAIMLVIGITIGGITVWKDTHCGMILGTEVCATPSSPATTPTSSPATLITWHRLAGTDNWYTTIDCSLVQCTTTDGAGPDGSTCYLQGSGTAWCER